MISNHRERQINAACNALTSRGGKFFDLPTILPASLVLELAGEGLRPRLFFVTAPDGSEMCLRPDLTIAAVVDYIGYAEYDNEPSAIACKGQVFRGARTGEDRAPEFIQIGLERFGEHDRESDVIIFLAAWDACRAGGLDALRVRFCDGGLLGAVISGANLDEIWRAALLEQIAHPRAFLNVLEQANGGGRMMSAFEQEIADLPFDAARAHVATVIAQGDLSLAATRTLDDVTSRLVLRAKRTRAAPIAPQIAETLHELATLRQGDATLEATLDHVVSLAACIDVDLAAWRAQWRDRLTDIAAQAPDALINARFEALGEEAFDYYDGMAFDIATYDNSSKLDFTRPVATGGRYDRLVGDVSSGARHAAAVGCVVRPDRFPLDSNGEGG